MQHAVYNSTYCDLQQRHETLGEALGELVNL
jgi:hypothetical protein